MGRAPLERLEPLQAASLKDVFIERFEHLILSGELRIGQRLPSERALALKLGVSRPVVHEGLVELAARGLVMIRPRVGTVVADYRREGSLALLASLVNQHSDDLDPALLDGILALRGLVETETARLAARNRGGEELPALQAVLERERTVDHARIDVIVDLDFSFHHLIALASGNPIYPMLVKSFEPAHRHLARRFFSRHNTAADVFTAHAQLVAAIEAGSDARAAAIMAGLLERGRRTLAALIHQAASRTGRASPRAGGGLSPEPSTSSQAGHVTRQAAADPPSNADVVSQAPAISPRTDGGKRATAKSTRRKRSTRDDTQGRAKSAVPNRPHPVSRGNSKRRRKGTRAGERSER